jgi:hypothetical protein
MTSFWDFTLQVIFIYHQPFETKRGFFALQIPISFLGFNWVKTLNNPIIFCQLQVIICAIKVNHLITTTGEK